jgi:undecaprenyl-diphosphatase
MILKKKINGRVSGKLLLGVLLFLISLFVFILIAHEVVIENEDWFDSRSFVFFRTHSSHSVIQVFKFITFFGSSVFLLPAWLLLIGILFKIEWRAFAVDIGILAITSTALLYGLKPLFARTRPEKPLFQELTNYSFPSGHALSSLIFCSALAWLIWKTKMSIQWKWTLTVLLLFLAVCIGVSRIVLRYHYASDVVGGFSLGISYMLLFLCIRNMIRRKNSNL